MFRNRRQASLLRVPEPCFRTSNELAGSTSAPDGSFARLGLIELRTTRCAQELSRLRSLSHLEHEHDNQSELPMWSHFRRTELVEGSNSHLSELQSGSSCEGPSDNHRHFTREFWHAVLSPLQCRDDTRSRLHSSCKLSLHEPNQHLVVLHSPQTT